MTSQIIQQHNSGVYKQFWCENEGLRQANLSGILIFTFSQLPFLHILGRVDTHKLILELCTIAKSFHISTNIDKSVRLTLSCIPGYLVFGSGLFLNTESVYWVMKMLVCIICINLSDYLSRLSRPSASRPILRPQLSRPRRDFGQDVRDKTLVGLETLARRRPQERISDCHRNSMVTKV